MKGGGVELEKAPQSRITTAIKGTVQHIFQPFSMPEMLSECNQQEHPVLRFESNRTPQPTITALHPSDSFETSSKDFSLSWSGHCLCASIMLFELYNGYWPASFQLQQ